MQKSKQQKVQPEKDYSKTQIKYQKSQTEDDFESEMKCNQTFEQINNYNLNDINKKDDKQCLRSCVCGQCFFYMKTSENSNNQDTEERRRQKRRQYKKRQKIKIQKQKQQALKDLAVIIAQLYALKTDAKKQIDKIENCLNLIQKNQIRFYEFINAVIRQQVEAIKKQMRICLSQLAADPPNFSKVPRLYQQFEKVNNASLQVEFIINYFNKIMAQKKKQVPSYHKDLDKQTFKYLLDSDECNKEYFQKVQYLVLNQDIKYQRQKQMLKIMIQIVNQKKLKSSYYSSRNGQQSETQQQDQQYYENDQDHPTSYSDQQGQFRKYYHDQQYAEDYPHKQNTTKSSQKEKQFQEQGYFEQYQQTKKKNSRRRKKNKNIKAYQVTFQKTYQTLVQLGKSLNNKKDDKLPCNLQQDWLNSFKVKYLKKSLIQAKDKPNL